MRNLNKTGTRDLGLGTRNWGLGNRRIRAEWIEMTRTFNCDSDRRLKLTLQLARDAESGKLDQLECPQCCKLTVSVWFSNPVQGEFRTWFLCTECNFYSRAHNSGRPKFFSTERCRLDLEERDVAVIDSVKFKRPDG